MVFQLPYPIGRAKRRVFVASSAPTDALARQELERWAGGHGFRPDPQAHTFTSYRNGRPVQEWVLLERDQAPS